MLSWENKSHTWVLDVSIVEFQLNFNQVELSSCRNRNILMRKKLNQVSALPSTLSTASTLPKVTATSKETHLI